MILVLGAKKALTKLEEDYLNGSLEVSFPSRLPEASNSTPKTVDQTEQHKDKMGAKEADPPKQKRKRKEKKEATGTILDTVETQKTSEANVIETVAEASKPTPNTARNRVPLSDLNSNTQQNDRVGAKEVYPPQTEEKGKGEEGSNWNNSRYSRN